jgi:hypothetical protein
VGMGSGDRGDRGNGGRGESRRGRSKTGESKDAEVLELHDGYCLEFVKYVIRVFIDEHNQTQQECGYD